GRGEAPADFGSLAAAGRPPAQKRRLQLRQHDRARTNFAAPRSAFGHFTAGIGERTGTGRADWEDLGFPGARDYSAHHEHIAGVRLAWTGRAWPLVEKWRSLSGRVRQANPRPRAVAVQARPVGSCGPGSTSAAR